jgi:5-methyltetrahydrofolate--homocysteine methyltransferase
MEAQLKSLMDAVMKGVPKDATQITKDLLEGGVGAEKILYEALIPAMDVIGDEFQNCEIYLPEMLMASKAMQSSMALLKPALAAANVQPVGRMVIGTVKDDMHDIGKNLVGMMAEGAGFEVFDLGVDVSPEKFAKAARDHNADIVGVSSLLTTTLPRTRSIVDILQREGLRDKTKVIIGGAAVTQEWADEIKADGYAADAASAVDKCRELLAELRKN